jgi:hypothetical protein
MDYPVRVHLQPGYAELVHMPLALRSQRALRMRCCPYHWFRNVRRSDPVSHDGVLPCDCKEGEPSRLVNVAGQEAVGVLVAINIRKLSSGSGSGYVCTVELVPAS